MSMGLFWGDENALKLDCVLHKSVKILKVIELHTLNE